MTDLERLGNASPVVLALTGRDVQKAGGVVAARDDRIKVRLSEAIAPEMSRSADFRASRGDGEGDIRESPLLSRMIKTPIDTLANATGLDMGDLAKLRQRAISWLSAVEGASN